MTPPASAPHDAKRSGLPLADLCIKRPVFAIMVNLLFVVLGWFSFQGIGVDQLPNIDLPIVTVTTTLRGASPEEMETSVTKPLEEIIKYMERWYGVEIRVAPELLDGELLTFKVKTESLNELLKLISLLKPIKYQIDGKQVVITKP